MKTIALFQDDTSKETIECGDGIIEVLSPYYNIKIFKKEQCVPETFSDVSMLVFPGGVGEADDYDGMFYRKRANAVADFIANGGAYLGICIGAYWAGKHYFDILDDIDVVQYIKRPTADIKKSYDTVAKVSWNNEKHKMFFRDGCTFVGDLNKCSVISTYANGDPMCIRQGKIGIMGACPDSLQSWYKHNYIKKHWHNGIHHKLLVDFVNDLNKT